MNLALTHIWQPSRIPSNDLMIVLHGLGDSAEGFLWLRDELGIDSLNYLLLNAPNPYYIGFSWYDLPPKQLPGILLSRDLLGQVLAEVEAAGYSARRTFLLGFSQGCLMTLEFGSRYSRRLAGYIGISGYCYDADAILREMNPEVNCSDWLITHGTEDEVLPVEATRSQIQSLNNGGFKIDYREYRKTHTIDPERELPQIRDWIRSRIVSQESDRH
jgi:phospholipase/carboxylesterase